MPRMTFTDPYRGLLRLLKEARKSANLNQSDVANRLGKPQSYVSKYERGERRIDIVELLLIIHAIGADPMRIVGKVQESLNLSDPDQS